MRTIVKPKFKDYFNVSDDYIGVEAMIHYEVQNFNKITSLIVLLLLILVLALINIKFITVFITISTYIFYLYLKLLMISKHIYVDRKVSEKAKENDKFKIHYIIKNKSPFKINELKLVDEFSGTSKKYHTMNIVNINSNTIENVKVSVPLNQGFGEHQFCEIKIVIEDILGLFQFKIITQIDKTILIYPKIQHILPLKTFNNDDSYLSGDYEVFTKGISPNFYGLRPYLYGDSFKKINWKVSSKFNELVVNEYENAVNLKINYILNFDKRAQMGVGVNSTWEYMRDLSLGLIKKDIEKNHVVEVFSNDMNITQGYGQSHFELIELKMCYLGPTEKSGEHLISRNIGNIQKGSALVYIAPLDNSSVNIENINYLKTNIAYFSDIHLFFIDAYDVTNKIFPASNKQIVQKGKYFANQYLNDEILPLRNLNIKIYIMEVKKPHLIRNQIKRII